MPDSSTSLENKPFPQFLAEFKEKLRQLFHVRTDLNEISAQRGLPPFVLREIMADNPLAIYVPQRYGGRGGAGHEGLALTAAASYESLPLSLGFGINWALFLQPVIKYAQDEAKLPLLKTFLDGRKMGGLMITEPGHGSDALRMQSCYTRHGDRYHLKGTKHWAGLTGWADFWLLTARQQNESGELMRDIDFFICDVAARDQHIVVEEVYQNLGIYMLPYGRNKIDVKIPVAQKLEPHSSGIKMMLDLLHRSRMQFPGMGMGFIQRMLDEAVAHCRDRVVGGRSLFTYDQVQQRLARLQSAFTVCSAMCLNSSHKVSIENDLAPHGLEANAVKTYLTDLMQATAQSLLQLVGAKGYRLNHIAGRAIVDSRPFQIFEGSNDILYIQIGEAIQKQLQRAKNANLLALLSGMELTGLAADRLRKLLDFSVRTHLPQRKLTELGKVVSRIVAMDQVIRLGQTPFNKELIQSSLSHIEQELTALFSSFNFSNLHNFYEGYEENSSWLNCYQS